jgi:hypothetical protein
MKLTAALPRMLATSSTELKRPIMDALFFLSPLNVNEKNERLYAG